MRYIPHPEHDLVEMLTVLGVRALDDLIVHLPENLRTRATLDLAPGISAYEVIARLSCLSEKYTVRLFRLIHVTFLVSCWWSWRGTKTDGST